MLTFAMPSQVSDWSFTSLWYNCFRIWSGQTKVKYLAKILEDAIILITVEIEAFQNNWFFGVKYSGRIFSQLLYLKKLKWFKERSDLLTDIDNCATLSYFS